MVIDLVSAGQTNLWLLAENAGQSIECRIIAGVQPVIEGDFTVSNFENLDLEPDSYWNGADGSGSFSSGFANLANHYNDAWGTWNGWAYSNMADDTTQGFQNQYSAITASGVDTESSGGENYAVSFVPADWSTYELQPVAMTFTDSLSHDVKGFFVTNSAYAALTMENGDEFTKKFGGNSGNDPDWFKLSITGYVNGSETGAKDFFLADYRFEDQAVDYIVKTWQWIDLSAFGAVDSLMFSLSSSDTGDFGMNTPAYFCVDNICIYPNSNSIATLESHTKIPVFPNPSTGRFYFGSEVSLPEYVQVYDAGGKPVTEKKKPGNCIDLGRLPDGLYYLKIRTKENTITKTVVKK